MALGGVQCICVGFNPVRIATQAKGQDAALHVVGRLMTSPLVLPSQTRENPASLLQGRLNSAIASCSSLLRFFGEGGAL